MSKINENDSAMPIQGFAYSAHGYESPIVGLTIRQHFAVLAMQGMLSACDGFSSNEHGEADNLAKCALVQADALIAELNKNNY